MPLTLRASLKEGVVRSTDDHPGILMVSANTIDGVSWGVTPNFEPPRGMPHGAYIAERGEDAAIDRTLLPVDEVIDAVQDTLTLAVVHRLSLMAARPLIAKALAAAQFDIARLVIEWTEDVYDAVAAAAEHRFGAELDTQDPNPEEPS